MMIVIRSPYPNELFHHGVKGQRWSIRRFQNLDGSRTYAGKKRYGSEGHGEEGETVTRKASLAVKIGLDIATLNLVGLGMDVSKIISSARSKSNEQKFISERENAIIDTKTGLPLKSKEYSEKEDLSRINPAFKDFNSNSKSNCMLCTTTYDLRKRGYDVTASKASIGYTPNDIKKWYPKAKILDISGVNQKGRPDYNTLYANLQKELSTQGKGARGNIMVTFSFGGGHSMAYEVGDGGNFRILDGQANKIYEKPKSSFFNIFANSSIRPEGLQLCRLDNVDFDKNAIRECVRW